MVLHVPCNSLVSCLREYFIGCLCLATFGAFIIVFWRLSKSQLPPARWDVGILSLSAVQCLLGFVYFGIFEEVELILAIRVLKILQCVAISWVFVLGFTGISDRRRVNMACSAITGYFVVLYVVLLVTVRKNSRYSCGRPAWLVLSLSWLFLSVVVAVVGIRFFRTAFTSRALSLPHLGWQAGRGAATRPSAQRAVESPASNQKGSSQQQRRHHYLSIPRRELSDSAENECGSDSCTSMEGRDTDGLALDDERDTIIEPQDQLLMRQCQTHSAAFPATDLIDRGSGSVSRSKARKLRYCSRLDVGRLLLQWDSVSSALRSLDDTGDHHHVLAQYRRLSQSLMSSSVSSEARRGALGSDGIVTRLRLQSSSLRFHKQHHEAHLPAVLRSSPYRRVRRKRSKKVLIKTTPGSKPTDEFRLQYRSVQRPTTSSIAVPCRSAKNRSFSATPRRWVSSSSSSLFPSDSHSRHFSHQSVCSPLSLASNENCPYRPRYRGRQPLACLRISDTHHAPWVVVDQCAPPAADAFTRRSSFCLSQQQSPAADDPAVLSDNDESLSSEFEGSDKARDLNIISASNSMRPKFRSVENHSSAFEPSEVFYDHNEAPDTRRGGRRQQPLRLHQAAIAEDAGPPNARPPINTRHHYPYDGDSRVDSQRRQTVSPSLDLDAMHSPLQFETVEIQAQIPPQQSAYRHVRYDTHSSKKSEVSSEQDDYDDDDEYEYVRAGGMSPRVESQPMSLISINTTRQSEGWEADGHGVDGQHINSPPFDNVSTDSIADSLGAFDGTTSTSIIELTSPTAEEVTCSASMLEDFSCMPDLNAGLESPSQGDSDSTFGLLMEFVRVEARSAVEDNDQTSAPSLAKKRNRLLVLIVIETISAVMTFIWDIVLYSFIAWNGDVTCSGFLSHVPVVEVVAYVVSRIFSSLLPHWAVLYVFYWVDRRLYMPLRSDWDVDLVGAEPEGPAGARAVTVGRPQSPDVELEVLAATHNFAAPSPSPLWFDFPQPTAEGSTGWRVSPAEEYVTPPAQTADTFSHNVA